MNMALCKRHFVFFVAVLAFLFFYTLHFAYGLRSVESKETFDLDAAPSLITDDEIESFLFRVNEVVRNKVVMLGGRSIICLPMPLLFGVSVGDVADTWGEARAGGRVHDGTDILVPRGELVVSPTEAVVTKIGFDNRGGNFVVTANPGGEQFYFAHLDSAAENLSIGDMLGPGDLIGYVGNTGNARGKLPHLHLGIYYKGVAQNPFPRLLCEFSKEEKIAALERILHSNKIELHANNGAVRFLQRFLITTSAGLHRDALARTGATGYFGMLTKNALAEYQLAVGIKPASGYFGSLTRASIQTLGGN